MTWYNTYKKEQTTILNILFYTFDLHLLNVCTEGTACGVLAGLYGIP